MILLRARQAAQTAFVVVVADMRADHGRGFPDHLEAIRIPVQLHPEHWLRPRCAARDFARTSSSTGSRQHCGSAWATPRSNI